MPYISAHLSTPLSAAQEITLKEKLGKAIELIPGKSERWLMVEFKDNCRLYFQGRKDLPCAYVEVKVFGTLDPANAEDLTRAICTIFHEEIQMDPARVYVKYEGADLWGWNGGNF